MEFNFSNIFLYVKNSRSQGPLFSYLNFLKGTSAQLVYLYVDILQIDNLKKGLVFTPCWPTLDILLLAQPSKAFSLPPINHQPCQWQPFQLHHTGPGWGRVCSHWCHCAGCPGPKCGDGWGEGAGSPWQRLLCSQIWRAVVQLFNDLKFRIFSKNFTRKNCLTCIDWYQC